MADPGVLDRELHGLKPGSGSHRSKVDGSRSGYEGIAKGHAYGDDLVWFEGIITRDVEGGLKQARGPKGVKGAFKVCRSARGNGPGNGDDTEVGGISTSDHRSPGNGQILHFSDIVDGDVEGSIDAVKGQVI